MRKFIFSIFIVVALGCASDAKKGAPLVNFIPQSAALVLKIPDYSLFQKTLYNNSFIKGTNGMAFYQDIESKMEFINFLNLKNPALLTFSTEGRSEVSYTFISREEKTLLPAEIHNIIKDSIEYEGYYIKNALLNGKEHFFSNLDSVFVLTESRLILENIIRQKDIPVSEDLLKAYNSISSKKASVIINHDMADELVNSILPNNNFLSFKKFARWSALDVEINESSLKLNGVATYSTSDQQIMSIFKGISPSVNEIAMVTPLNAISLYSFTFSDFKKLKQNIENYHTNREPFKTDKEPFFSQAKEIGTISFKDDQALVVSAASITEIQEHLLDENIVAKNYRETDILKFSNGNVFHEVFNPLIKAKDLNYYTVLDHFLIFSEKVETLEHIIANFQNETVLEKQDFYKNTLSSLSSESSMLMVSINKNMKEEFSGLVSATYQKEIKNLGFNEYPVTALQFISDGNFAHIHAVLEKNTSKTGSTGNIAQTAATSLDSRLVTDPIIFTNHLNNQKEIVVQDENNMLYLISGTGNILWKKQLSGPILGEVQQVDLYKNNKYQLAFATPGKLHILDRNGNDVKPFPISLKNNITQPLAVFDYDNNRNYRFVIVQGENLVMYDGNGKIVSGFKFKRANGEITKAPKHIRIGRKDYILIPDASGKLHITDRQGNARVKVSEKIDFSENQWHLYNNKFVSTNSEGDLLLINENGKIEKEQLNLDQNHFIDATEKTLVTISENILRIKDREVEMDYGIFSKPKIFYLNDKLYISVTDLQAHRVYLFDSNAELLPNFPVYGNSSISLGNFDADKALEFAVQGEENGILFYELN